MKEKAELEKEYAKGLRKLIARYQPRKLEMKIDSEESSELSCFR